MGPRLPLIAPAAGCDCRTCAFFTGNPKAVEPICSGCNTDCAYCPFIDYTEAVTNLNRRFYRSRVFP